MSTLFGTLIAVTWVACPASLVTYSVAILVTDFFVKLVAVISAKDESLFIMALR
jgi:hypothetical protein